MSDEKIAKLEVATFPLVDINPATYNPRIALEKGDPDYQRIVDSINGFGYADPMIVNTFNNVLISGHQRYRVLIDLGFTHADVSLVRIEDPLKEKSMNIAMNKIAGRWDDGKLREILLEFDEYGDYAKLAGYEMQEFEQAKKFEDSLEMEELGRSPSEAKEVYDQGTIKQIVLYYTGDVYEDRVAALTKIGQEHGFESNTDVVDYLLEFYEKHRSKTATV